MSRRGKVSHMYSNNGTNFLEANKELLILKTLFDSQEFSNNVINALANQQITWHFITPRSPHMEGLWESAVKSTKYHLKRVIGATLLNYDDMNSVLTMIEACLNSRPLSPLSNDPSDLEPLTPGYFLIGEALNTPPEPDITHIPVNRLSRYQLTEQIKQSFWKRCSQEVLYQLQQRIKWTNSQTRQPHIEVLVVLKEDNISPLQCPIGRICDLHPGM